MLIFSEEVAPAQPTPKLLLKNRANHYSQPADKRQTLKENFVLVFVNWIKKYDSFFSIEIKKRGVFIVPINLNSKVCFSRRKTLELNFSQSSTFFFN